MRMFLSVAIVPAAFLTMAQAAPPTATTPQAKAQSDYLNHVVCEKQEVVGSRLATKKVCKTRAEWMRDRLDDQKMVDKIQTMQGNLGN